MQCVKCKKEIQEDSVFCPYCGREQRPKRRRYKKRANGSGTICKLPGNRGKPYQARKNGVTIGTFATRVEAENALARLTDTVVTSSYNTTFKEAFEKWIRQKKKIDKGQLYNYRNAFSHCPQLHDRKIRTIKRSEYQDALIIMDELGYSKSACNHMRSLFTSVSTWAVGDGIMPSSHATDLEITAAQKKRREVFEDADVAKLKKSPLPAAEIALVMISCGCRPNELFSVKLEDCKMDHFIWGSKTEKGKGRVIPIGTDGIDAYQALYLRALASGGNKLIDGYRGKNHTQDNFARRDWKELVKSIGRDTVTPYCCRHTFITRAILSGVDLITLQDIVGHVDAETTKLYTHLKAKDLVAAVRKTNDAVDYKFATRLEVSQANSEKSSESK